MKTSCSGALHQHRDPHGGNLHCPWHHPSDLFLLSVLDLPLQLHMEAEYTPDLYIWPKPWMHRWVLSRKLYIFWMNTWISNPTLSNQSSCTSFQAQTCEQRSLLSFGDVAMLQQLFLITSVSRKWIESVVHYGSPCFMVCMCPWAIALCVLVQDGIREHQAAVQMSCVKRAELGQWSPAQRMSLVPFYLCI